MADGDGLPGVIVQRIQRTHGWLLKVARDLDDDLLARQFGPAAPAIGWHLWHIARWADRIQATFPNHPFEAGRRWDRARQIWFAGTIAERWKLDPATLGILQTGVGMAFEAAALVPRAGKAGLIPYAGQCFGALDAALAALVPEQMSDTRNSVMEFTADSQGLPISEGEGPRTTIGADLGFHLSHASRHLGMMEGLRGLLDRPGTATG
jgi:hypothetical protein